MGTGPRIVNQMIFGGARTAHDARFSIKRQSYLPIYYVRCVFYEQTNGTRGIHIPSSHSGVLFVRTEVTLSIVLEWTRGGLYDFLVGTSGEMYMDHHHTMSDTAAPLYNCTRRGKAKMTWLICPL